MSVVTLLAHMGDDLMVANAARVSFHKETGWQDPAAKELSERDEKLIQYLASHQHWTPFAHPQIQFRIKMPIFVRSQWYRHTIAVVRNEVSRRYVDEPPEFFSPSEWRRRPTNGIKQGSSDEIATRVRRNGWMVDINPEVEHFHNEAKRLYQDMIASGVAPEQARMILPQTMFTEFYETGSLAAYARICKLRLDPHAQKEIRDVAQQVSDLIAPLFPVSWEALT